MSFELFIQNGLSTSFWEDKKSVCFVGKEYSLLFFEYYFKQAEQNDLFGMKLKKHIAYFSASSQAKDYVHSVCSQLSQSFLGEYFFYWLGDLSVLPKKDKKYLLSFLAKYEGNHRVAFFGSDEDVSAFKRMFSSVIETPAFVNQETFMLLNSFFGKNLQSARLSLVKKIVANAQGITLDKSCMLFEYLSLVSLKDLAHFEQYAESIFESFVSLSLLSQHFFSKNKKAFFEIWVDIEGEYSPFFWVSFWSEQLWRAYYFVDFMQKNDTFSARKMSFRLPSSFTRLQWQKFTLKELAQEYEFIYEIDFSLKVGSSFCAFDVFYGNHFVGTFS